MNKFTNDGSFMEQFRKKMESQKSNSKEDKDKKSTEACVSQSEDNNEAAGDKKGSSERTAAPTAATRTDTLPGPSSTSSSSKNIDIADDTKQSDVTTSPADKSGGSLTVKKKHSVLSFVGKRPGSQLTLKTGQVKKKRQEEESEPADAWSKYMAEVKKFRKGLDEEGKNRPLIK